MRCNSKYKTKGITGCENKHVDDEVLYSAFIEVYNTIMDKPEQLINKWKDMLQHENALNRAVTKRFINTFESDRKINEFDPDIFYMLVESYIINKAEIIVCLLDKTEFILSNETENN